MTFLLFYFLGKIAFPEHYKKYKLNQEFFIICQAGKEKEIFEVNES